METIQTYRISEYLFSVENDRIELNKNTTIAGALGIVGSLDVVGNRRGEKYGLSVDTHGNTTITKKLDIDGPLDVSEKTVLHDTLRVDKNTKLKQTLTVDDNVTIGGMLDIAGTTTSDSWHNIKRGKTINSIGTSPTNTLSLTFANLAGTTAPLQRGALVKLSCFVAGTISATDSINLYKSELVICPGATSIDSCTRTIISESTTNIVGSSTTITSDISGVGTNATITLTSTAAMSAQAVDIFYEIMSSNLTSAS